MQRCILVFHGCMEPLYAVIRMCTVHSYMIIGPSGENVLRMFCQSRRHHVHQHNYAFTLYLLQIKWHTEPDLYTYLIYTYCYHRNVLQA